MGNASLKEQLQALSLASTATLSNKDKKAKKTRVEKTASKQKPAWLEYAQYGVELLKAHFPNCFKDAKEVQPLKKGIKQDLVKELSTRDEIVISDKACMVSSLSYYVNSIAYHRVVIEKAIRIDLQGNASGEVTAEEANYSAECRKNKLLKKKNPKQANVQAPSLETANVG